MAGSLFYTLLFVGILQVVQGQAPSFNLTFATFDTQIDLPATFALEETLCHAGVWIVYTSHNYVFESSLQILLQVGPVCEESFMGGGINSVRYAGHPDDILTPAVSVFSHEDFGGDKFTFDETEGVPKLAFPIYSLVTVDTRIELFQGENFEGESFCLDPETWCNYEPLACYVLTWDYFETPFDPTTAKSARAGCTVGAVTANALPQYNHLAKNFIIKR